MSFKPTVEVHGEPGKYHTNGLAFATQQEALDYARDLSGRWVQVTDWSFVESDEPVNYAYHNGHLMAPLAAEAANNGQ